MNTIYETNNLILQQAFITELVNTLNKIKRNRRIVIGLSGGNSLKIFYEILQSSFYAIDENIREKIFFCLLDERIVPFSDENSNYKGLKEALFDTFISKKLISEKQILLPNFQRAHYEKIYSHKVGKIDIGLFGVGEDGHICSLFPQHPLLENNIDMYLVIDDSPKAPSRRITVSRKMLDSIPYPFVFFMGQSKKSALKQFLSAQILPTDCPAKFLAEHSNIQLFSNILLD